jgi:hypothetical protein
MVRQWNMERNKMRVRKLYRGALGSILLALILSCSRVSESPRTASATPIPSKAAQEVDRQAQIPPNAVKMSPESDEHPPQVHSSEYEPPIPLPGDVNTAGAEDSPFITLDGNSLYFFFTPDANIPAEKQLSDGVTGIYVSHKVNDEWSKGERILLQDPGKLALDGCEFVLGDIMWFCSAREGYTGVHWFTAENIHGSWQNWEPADFNPAYQVGELYISRDGTELYFGSDRPGGKGGLDIWVSEKQDGIWQVPVNLAPVNTADREGWPALNSGGDELWFYRNYSIWRSKKVGGEWQAAELMVSSLAGEPSLDEAGNLYFVHHFYSGDRLIEADIYVAYKR